MPTIRVLLLLVFIPLLYATWLYQLNHTVPDPYLDEVFHIRQAQAYCEGRFGTWDPKITTPPGLYLISYVLVRLRRLVSSSSSDDACSVGGLRLLNAVITLLVLPLQIWDLRNHLGLKETRRIGHDHANLVHANLVHAVSNICLFPLLFFFSGLYYTDVCSVSLVLAAYQCHVRGLRRHGTASKGLDAIMVFLLGLGALLMRQTNIFWVAVFLGGQHAVQQVKQQSQTLDQPLAGGSPDSPSSVSRDIHDPSISEAYLEDYIETAISLAKSALKDPVSLLLSLWPYLALLGSFALFVLLNGGVVLGDRENHLASLHIPQMLYIWPYITFFSWPVILPHLLHHLLSDNTISIIAIKPLHQTLPRPIVALPIMATMSLAVHYNTIIHPFTLADNRHYVFYVFRLLLRHPAIKYAAVPVYFLCAWAAIVALGGGFPVTPLAKNPAAKQPAATNLPEQEKRRPAPAANARRTSFLLVFLTATALSLITAPLVEPRYFILPWLIWRLHVQFPQPPPHQPPPAPAANPTRPLGFLLRLPASTWLWVETLWFLTVNLATAAMFLYRGFAWVGQAREVGEGGNGVQVQVQVQRFMW